MAWRSAAESPPAPGNSRSITYFGIEVSLSAAFVALEFMRDPRPRAENTGRSTRHRAQQAERCPCAAEIGDGHRVRERRGARVGAGAHRPGPILPLVRDEERDSSVNLR